jgi:hypothetical protein
VLLLKPGFTDLERTVLDAICKMHRSHEAGLKTQFSTAAYVSRENSGSGFFIRFTVERGLSTALKGERLRKGPEAKIHGLQYGMDFILWLEQRYPVCLEGYS